MENMLSELNNLKTLINGIQGIYSQITNIWMETEANINLKKTQVSKIDTNGAIYEKILEYVRLLHEWDDSIYSQLYSLGISNVTMRIKTQNSIEYKIQNYKTLNHQMGRVPIIKCLNDLFGVRIVLSYSLTYDDVYALVDGLYCGKYRCIDSSKHNYKATHLYFRLNNFSFPWGLQIWNKVDATNNLLSHKEYKQDYVVWEWEENTKGERLDD